jgi:hypothetical protein
VRPLTVKTATRCPKCHVSLRTGAFARQCPQCKIWWVRVLGDEDIIGGDGETGEAPVYRRTR